MSLGVRNSEQPDSETVLSPLPSKGRDQGSNAEASEVAPAHVRPWGWKAAGMLHPQQEASEGASGSVQALFLPCPAPPHKQASQSSSPLS